MGVKTSTVVLILFVILISSAVVFSYQTAEAVKGNGVPLLETTSKKVCGNLLCDTPMSIKEKIEAYLFVLNQKLNQESTILQQALPTALVPKSLKAAPSVSVGSGIVKDVPSLTPKSIAPSVAPDPVPSPRTTAPVAIQRRPLHQHARENLRADSGALAGLRNQPGRAGSAGSEGTRSSI